jgi:hypothetical protein
LTKLVSILVCGSWRLDIFNEYRVSRFDTTLYTVNLIPIIEILSLFKVSPFGGKVV